MNRIRLLIADDHSVVLAGLVGIFRACPDVEVVGECGDWARAQQLALELRPDVAVLDLIMPGPGLNGVEATAQIGRAAPGVNVLVLTAHEEPAFLKQALAAGARGYVLKRATADELVRAVRAVAGGGVYLDSELLGRVALGQFAAGPARGDGLSEREDEVLRLLAVGYTNKEIGARLRISVKTVETYKTRAMEKLSLDSRVDIVRYAAHHGWLTDA
jgi:DNA-binding NarL/FixJ family response regulator